MQQEVDMMADPKIQELTEQLKDLKTWLAVFRNEHKISDDAMDALESKINEIADVLED